MAEQDIYKLVEQLNKNKISDNSKIEEIYNLLDSIKVDNNKSKSDVSSSKKTPSLSDLKSKIKPIRRPVFPSEIMVFENRSDCFVHILQEVDYGSDNNEDYVSGHKAALEKYFMIAKNNSKNFYVVEGQVKDELAACKRANNTSAYARGYYDGLNFILAALNKSRDLMSEKVYRELLKELS